MSTTNASSYTDYRIEYKLTAHESLQALVSDRSQFQQKHCADPVSVLPVCHLVSASSLPTARPGSLRSPLRSGPEQEQAECTGLAPIASWTDQRWSDESKVQTCSSSQCSFANQSWRPAAHRERVRQSTSRLRRPTVPVGRTSRCKQVGA